MTRVALTLQEAADRIGVTRSTLRTYKFIDPDVKIGNVSGYWPESVDAWNAARPGQGARVDLRETRKPPIDTSKGRRVDLVDTGEV